MMRITIEFLKQFAKEKGGECLSSKYVNPTVPVKWKCSNGHTWESQWKSVYDKRWCRKCHIESIKLGIGVAKQIAENKDDVKYFVRFSYKEDIFDIEYIKNKLLSIMEKKHG